MDQAHWMIVVPTEMESNRLQEEFERVSALSGVTPEIVWRRCGFGPVVAAARMMQLIHQESPDRVVLVGISGVYEKFQAAYPIGSAISFETVACDGIGAGEGESFRSATSLGWDQWSDGENAIGDTLSLAPVEIVPRGDSKPRQLLTVCSAAGDAKQADRRQASFPQAIAEDMEAFGVATACRLQQIPCSVIRGISNRAGNRDKQDWDIPAALVAAARFLAQAVLSP